MKRDGDAEVMGHRRASQAGIWIKREEFCAGFVMGDKGGSVTKKTQNRDKTPATLHMAAVKRIVLKDGAVIRYIVD